MGVELDISGIVHLGIDQDQIQELENIRCEVFQTSK